MKKRDNGQQDLIPAEPEQTEFFEVESASPDPQRGYPELWWKGKRPFNGVHYYPAQHKESHGEAVDGWRNRLYWGDNLQVMGHMLREYRGAIQLVYIDPPFDSKADYNKTIQLRGLGSATASYNGFEEKQYADIWVNDSYLQFMYERLALVRELLAPTGSLFVHCDWHKSAQLRCILDELFGPECFRNEIVWHYYNKMQGNVGRFASNHDTILFYSKSNSFTFNRIREQRDKPVRQIKRVWDSSKGSIVNAKDENGKVIYIDSTHKTIDDVWRLPMLQPADRTEAVGYPTQKPEALLERVISAASVPGDLVFDCFMGSGTTLAVATKLGRRCIGADINLGAIHATAQRLVGVAAASEDEKGREIKNGLTEGGYDGPMPNKFFGGVDVFTVNRYDVFRNEVEARSLLMEALGVRPLTGESIWHGELGEGNETRMVRVMPVNRIATKADLSPVIQNIDYRALASRRSSAPNKPVERITLLCMGHEPDLAAELATEIRNGLNDPGCKVDIDVVDVLREKDHIQFKRDSEARIILKGGQLAIERFYPMNLLQKLSMERTAVSDWRELVDSVLIDFNFDGAVLRPSVSDIPGRGDLVAGVYDVPEDAGTIRVKITDVLSDVFETSVEVDNG